MVVGRLRSRSASRSRASRIRACSKAVRVPLPSSNMQSLNRLTTASRASLLCESPRDMRSVLRQAATVAVSCILQVSLRAPTMRESIAESAGGEGEIAGMRENSIGRALDVVCSSTLRGSSCRTRWGIGNHCASTTGRVFDRANSRGEQLLRPSSR